MKQTVLVLIISQLYEVCVEFIGDNNLNKKVIFLVCYDFVFATAFSKQAIWSNPIFLLEMGRSGTFWQKEIVLGAGVFWVRTPYLGWQLGHKIPPNYFNDDRTQWYLDKVSYYRPLLYVVRISLGTTTPRNSNNSNNSNIDNIQQHSTTSSTK